MGIPLFYDLPASSRPRQESAAKPDATAASTRSPIRRQRTIRHPPTWSVSRLGNSRRGRVPLVHSPLAQWESLGRGSDRESSREPRSAGDSMPLDDESRLDWPSVSTAASSLRQREQRLRLVEDHMRHSSPYRRHRHHHHREPPRPPRFEVPSPPWSDNERSRDSSSPNIATTSHTVRRPSFTPRFAPAYPAANDSLGSASVPPLVSRSEEINAHMPLLRRVGHRSISGSGSSENLLHRSQSIDGLGDRERSFSPGDDNETHDMWETLLTTIRPDDNLPSMDSSFTSTAAASSNALSGNSADSSQTGLSTHRFDSPRLPPIMRDPFPFPDFVACDISSSEGSDTEADSDADEHDSRRPSGRGFRGYLGQQLNRNGPERTTRTESALPVLPDSDLQQLRSIVDRLARRDDIPDDWWASVGLSRTLSPAPRVSSGENRAEDGPAEPL